MKSCPNDSQLEHFAQADFSQDQSQFFDEHVAECSKCQQAILQHRDAQLLFVDLKKAIKQDWFGIDTNEVKSVAAAANASFVHAMESKGYKIVGEIYRGGQGIVHKALQQTTQRLVAIKQPVFQFGSNTEQFRRFEREIEIIARLNHPNIVTVFDSGSFDGQPFLVMELVDGQPLDVFIRSLRTQQKVAQKTDVQFVAQVLNLFQKICSAVSYAHRLGVIHRDLKPGNILVNSHAEPQVLDFGLAKLSDVDQRLELTHTGQFLGTLAYASPEQVRVDSRLIDVRTDVYSLGVILYEMLTGKLPYAVDGGLLQAIENIANSKPINPGRICHSIDHDVETIILKSLEKEPGRRYQSAEQLIHDIKLYKNHQPIDAKRDRIIYVFRKLLHRHKGLGAAIAFVVFVILSALVVSVFLWNQTVNQRNLAIKAKGNESIAREEAEYQSYIANIGAAKGAVLSFDIAEAKRRLNNAPETYRNWEFAHWLRRTDLSRQTINLHSLFIHDFEVLPDQQRIASIAGDNTLNVWYLKDPEKCDSIKFAGRISSCSANRDGSSIALVVNGQSIRVFDADTLAETSRYDADVQILDLTFLPTENRMAFVGKTPKDICDKIFIWDLEKDDVKVASSNLRNIASISPHPNLSQLAVAGEQFGILDVATSKFKELFGEKFSSTAEFDSTGELIAVVIQNEVILLDAKNGEKLNRLIGHSLAVTDIDFSDDNKSITTSSFDRTVRTWDVATGNQRSLLWGHGQPVMKTQFIDDSRLLITASKDASFKIWDSGPVNIPRRLSRHSMVVRDVDFHPNNRLIATASDDGQVVIHDVLADETVRTFRHRKAVFSIDFSPDGSMIATGGDEHVIRIWNIESGNVKQFEGHSDRVHSVSFSPDGRQLVSGSRDGTVRVWNIETTNAVHVVDSHRDCVHKARFNQAGDLIASRSHSDIRIWDANTMNQIDSFDQRIGPEDFSLVFHPDGKRLAAGSSIEGFGRGFVNLLNITNMSVEKTFEQHNSPITSFDFNHDGTRAVSSSFDSIKVWDVQRTQEVVSLDGVSSDVHCVQFSPDGTKIAAGMLDGSVVIWDSLPLRSIQK